MINFISNSNINNIPAGLLATIVPLDGSVSATPFSLLANPNSSISSGYSQWVINTKDLCKQYKENPSILLGEISVYEVNINLFIVNLFAQFSNKPYNRNVDLVAFKEALIRLRNLATQHNRLIYFPKVHGVNNFGMDWDQDLLPVIEEVFKHNTISFTILD